MWGGEGGGTSCGEVEGDRRGAGRWHSLGHRWGGQWDAIYRKSGIRVGKHWAFVGSPRPTPALTAWSVWQEKRRRQAEIENRRRQLEDDRRQLQHLKVRAEPRPGRGRQRPGTPALARAGGQEG